MHRKKLLNKKELKKKLNIKQSIKKKLKFEIKNKNRKNRRFKLINFD